MTERTQQKINEEYTLALARLGEINWNVEKKYPHEQDELYKKLRNLENEAKTMQERKRQEPATEAIKAQSATKDIPYTQEPATEPVATPEEVVQ